MSNANILSPELFNQLLKLPNIEITSIEQINDEIFIYISSIEETADCHQCRKKISTFYEFNPAIKLRHLSVLNCKCYIILKPKQLLCKSCNKATTQSCCWYHRKAKATLEYENHILLSMINSTIEFVEGLNTKIKVIKRRCYEITNIQHLFQRIFLDLEGYKVFKYQ